jgi:hypothetical protein
MIDINYVDIAYDFSEDYKKNIDPDKDNKILRNWHKILWEKCLPDKNIIFTLVEKDNGLYHNSDLGEYYLTSDSIINTYSRHTSIADIINQVPQEEKDDFFHIACRMGAYILFPGNRIGKSLTINGARGFNRKIADRFDLTLECIRLYYNGEINTKINPLGNVINRYDNFFKLFKNLKGYCDFFLLQDLTLDSYSRVNFFLPFNGFNLKQRPSSVEEYYIYKEKSIDFVNKRNIRINDYIKNIYKMDHAECQS